jgi:hypothetical protein
MEQANIAAARRTFNALVLAGNELFTQHMYRYVEAGSHPQQMRSGMPFK